MGSRERMDQLLTSTVVAARNLKLLNSLIITTASIA